MSPTSGHRLASREIFDNRGCPQLTASRGRNSEGFILGDELSRVDVIENASHVHILSRWIDFI